MNALLIAGMLLASHPLPDTTVALQRGDTVVVSDVEGSVTVTTWSRSELSVAGEGGDEAYLEVRRRGAILTVRPADRKGRELEVDLVVRVPPWVSLEVRGRELDVSIAGVTGGAKVRNVSGDIRASGAGGGLEIRSADGEIRVEDAEGSVTAISRGDDVTLRRIRGPVHVQSGSGDLVLQDIQSASVRAETLDGDLTFDGPLARGGVYTFLVHDGDAHVAVPDGTAARVSISTFDGDFSSDFPITLQGYGGGGSFQFTLGDGSAQMEIQVFDGRIRLLRRR